MSVCTVFREATGRGRLGRASPPVFQTLAKDMSLREAQHILQLDQGHVLSHPCYYKYTSHPSYNKYTYARPPLKITQLRPCYFIFIQIIQNRKQFQINQGGAERSLTDMLQHLKIGDFGTLPYPLS